MKKQWLRLCDELCSQPADFYSGARKILRNQIYSFRRIGPTLSMGDIGYTKSKTSMLLKNYLHEESRTKAVELWERRIGQSKYGSVGFTTYNHFVKNDPNKKSKRASVMGPCIQSVTLTLLNDGSTAIDVFYRTTEVFKKFPADLVFLRDNLMTPFNVESLESLTFHFANVTCHPMYYVTLIPHLASWNKSLEKIKSQDRYFYDWVVKWTARYLCPQYQRGIQKFAQAMRVQKTAQELISKQELKYLQQYLMDNHPGYRNEYQEKEEDK